MLQKDILNSKIKIFLFALLSNLRVNLVGQIPLSELFIIPFSFSINYWKNVWKIADVRKVNIAFLLFLGSQIVSDFINHSSFNNAARGWANILMAIFVFSFLTTQLNRDKSIIILFLIAQTISLSIFDPFIEGLSPAESMSYFKFLIAPILNNLILILSYYLLSKSKVNSLLVVIVLFIYGLICMFLDSRSNGFFIILTGLILFYRNGLRKMTSRRILIFSFIFTIIFQVAYIEYVSQVLSGKFGGEHAREQLVRLKNPYNPFSLIESGRSEFFVALYAIKDKPVFGHGSWASDPGGKYNSMMFEMHNEKDKFASFYQNSGELIIPSHSVVLGAWMTAGICGFLCIGYVFIIFIKRGISLMKSPVIMNTPLAPIIIFFYVNGIWTFLFSPLPSIRMPISIFMALVIIMNTKLTAYNNIKHYKYRSIKKR